MLPTRRPAHVTPRLGAGAALLSTSVAVEVEAATLLVAPSTAALAATVAVVEVLAVMGVLTWSVALAALLGLFCIRAAHVVRRRRQDDLPRRHR